MNIITSFSHKIESFLPITEQDVYELNQAEGMKKIFLIVQKTFSFCKILPQYKYFTRPIYKFVASKSNIAVATATTFFVTDLVIHQFFQGTVLRCILSSGQNCSFSYDPYTSAFWMALSIPVMIAKYQT